MTRVRVTKSDPPESKEVLAEAIVKISDGFDAMLKSGLNRRAVIILLNHRTKVSMGDIRIILDGLKQMKGWYCR